MSDRVVLLQHVPPGYREELLQISHATHELYCRNFDIEFRKTVLRRMVVQRHPRWEFIAAIERELRELEDGSLLVWLNPEALITGFNDDLRNALPEDKELGLVQHGNTDFSSLSQNSTAALYIRANAHTRDFFRDVFTLGPIANEAGLQTCISFNHVLKHRLALKWTHLDPRWNCLRYPAAQPTPPAVVTSWRPDPLEDIIYQMPFMALEG